jgi:hypothetical protein
LITILRNARSRPGKQQTSHDDQSRRSGRLLEANNRSNLWYPVTCWVTEDKHTSDQRLTCVSNITVLNVAKEAGCIQNAASSAPLGAQRVVSRQRETVRYTNGGKVRTLPNHSSKVMSAAIAAVAQATDAGPLGRRSDLQERRPLRRITYPEIREQSRRCQSRRWPRQGPNDSILLSILVVRDKPDSRAGLDKRGNDPQLISIGS